MSAQKDLYRRKLNNLLELAPDQSFITMCWATHAMQSGSPDTARPFLNFPEEAAQQSILSPWKIHPWTLETAVNELLTVPKHPRLRTGQRIMNCSSFESMKQVRNTLRSLEEAEDILILRRTSAVREMSRITQRQIEWQRGFWRENLLYRSAYLFGGPMTCAYFKTVTGVSLNEFSLSCTAFLTLSWQAPSLSVSGDALTLSKATMLKVLERISLPLDEARKLATDIRKGSGHTSYKPSILRTHPLIEISGKYFAPLPELVGLRSASGIFYDIVSGPQEVKSEVGKRFEDYCVELVQLSCPEAQIRREAKYTVKRGRTMATPDCRMYLDDKLAIVFECKATRMSFDARFSETPRKSAARGYSEIAKGVYQIWRYLSHVRRGLVPGEQTQFDAVGVVLTLEPWLSMANHIRLETLVEAGQLADARDEQILTEDRVDIVFCQIDELEATLASATLSSFVSAVRAASGTKYLGWQLSSVHQELWLGPPIINNYPFSPRMSEVLPWWGVESE